MTSFNTRPQFLFKTLCVGLLWTQITHCKTRSSLQKSTPNTSQGNSTSMAQEDSFFAGCSNFASPALLEEWKKAAFIGTGNPNQKFAVIGLNDFHGHLEEETVTLSMGNQSLNTKVGGVGTMVSYFEILCEHYKGSVIFLDAGDAYQGTLVSNLSKGRAIISAFNELGIHASTFGNHEFDFGQETLKQILNSDRKFYYLSSSLKDSNQPAEMPWKKEGFSRYAPSLLLTVGKIKVGIVGFTTPSTPFKVYPENVKGLTFLEATAKLQDDSMGVLAAESERLRASGAQYLILLAHAGGECDMSRQASEGESACNPVNDEAYDFLKNKGGFRHFDAVFGGHSHNAQRHYINGTALMQSNGQGQSFSYLEVEINSDSRPQSPKKERIISETLNDPIFFCWDHFKGFDSCNPNLVKWNRTYPSTLFASSPIQPQFLGKTVNREGPVAQKALKVIKPYLDAVNAEKSKFIINLPNRLQHDRVAESTLGNCITDAIHLFTQKNQNSNSLRGLKTDLVMLNSGGIRKEFPAGDLTYNDIFTSLPFDNMLIYVQVNGQELLALAQSFEKSPGDIPYVSYPFQLEMSKKSAAPYTQKILKDQVSVGPNDRYGVVVSDFSSQFVKTVLGEEKFVSQSRSLGVTVRDAVASGLKSKPAPSSCLTSKLGRIAWEI